MDTPLIEQRIKLGEDSKTEFKSVAKSDFKVDPHDMAKAIVAMANREGELIFLGVEDDGELTGVGDILQADSIMRQVSQICSNSIRPPIWCTIEKRALQGKNILIVTVPAFSTDRPYQTGGKFYVRDVNQSRVATREELVRLLQSTDAHFDEAIVPHSKKEDLDEASVQEFARKVYGRPWSRDEYPEYLRALKCLGPDDTPTVAAILFFGKSPDRWMVHARITAVRIPGRQFGTQFLDQQEIVGRIPQQIAATETYVRKHILSASHVEGWNRVGHPGPGGIPDEVLREAILNAVTHRDYRASSQVKVFVLDDRVEIVNPGDLLNRLTMESIKKAGISQLRNPILAHLISRDSKRENIGFGVPEMIKLMKQQGAPEPEFTLEGGHFRVVLYGRAAGT